MASRLDSGSMALLSYANTVASLIYSVIGISFNNIVYTSLSEKQNNDTNIKTIFDNYKFLLLSILLPCCIVMLVYSKDVCNIIYGRGSMNENAITILSILLIFYIPSAFSLCVKDLYNRLLYIHKKTKLTSIINFCGLILNILFNINLSKLLGVYGLALATSLTSILTLTITKLYCKRYIDVHVKKIIILCIKSVLVWIICVMLKFTLCNISITLKILIIMISAVTALVIFNYEVIKKGFF